MHNKATHPDGISVGVSGFSSEYLPAQMLKGTYLFLHIGFIPLLAALSGGQRSSDFFTEMPANKWKKRAHICFLAEAAGLTIRLEKGQRSLYVEIVS